jgi:hypothetical protein
MERVQDSRFGRHDSPASRPLNGADMRDSTRGLQLHATGTVEIFVLSISFILVVGVSPTRPAFTS